MRPTSPADARRLHVAEVGEEGQQAGKAFGDGGVGGAFGFEFEQIEDLAARGEQPAERVGQGEGDALAGALVELGAIGIGGFEQVLEGPEPHLHGGGEGAGAGAGAVVGDEAHFADPLAELGQEELVGHGDAELAALHRLGAFVGGLQLANPSTCGRGSRGSLR